MWSQVHKIVRKCLRIHFNCDIVTTLVGFWFVNGRFVAVDRRKRNLVVPRVCVWGVCRQAGCHAAMIKWTRDKKGGKPCSVGGGIHKSWWGEDQCGNDFLFGVPSLQCVWFGVGIFRKGFCG